MSIEQENPFNKEPMWPNVTPEEDSVLKKHWGNPDSIELDQETLENLDKDNRSDKDR